MELSLPERGIPWPSRSLGVGIVYGAELRPLFCDSTLVSVVEVEPQTLWRRADEAPGEITVDLASVEKILALPQHRIAHGIGMPFGGSVSADPRELEMLIQSLDTLRPEWFSEHLSFNRSLTERGTRMAGFLLPPRQTADAVELAAFNIREIRALIGTPVAFETGVNYLKPDLDDLTDGDFFAGVAHRGECGIVLDLHNLWVNERNGRQALCEVLTSLPAERVWEIHLAGGSDLDGFALDSHSALVPDELLLHLELVLNTLRQVRAVIFEILPPYVHRVGLDSIARQLEVINRLWKRRRTNVEEFQFQYMAPMPHMPGKDTLQRVRDSENNLLASINSAGLDADPGVRLYQRLINDFRSGAVAQCLPNTIALLFLTLGKHGCELLMARYTLRTDPQAFAEDEAFQFLGYLESEAISNPLLRDVAGFEAAVISTARTGQSVQIEFDYNPEVLFGALLKGRLPVALPLSPTLVTLTATWSPDAPDKT